MDNKLYVIILLVSSFFIHFLFFGRPNEVVFDEVWYGRHVNDYINGTFHFDGHPPLGRMTIGGFAKVMGYQPESSFANISEKFPDRQYLILRFLPTLAGAVLPLIIYLIIRELGMTPFAAFAGSMLIVLENGFVAQSRLLLMDSPLILYEFASLFFYLRYRNHKKIYMLFLTSIFGGLAFAVKWVGLSFVALPILFEGLGILSEMKRKGISVLKSSRTWLAFTALVITPFVVYFSAVTAYSLILHKSGTGDAFMSTGYQKTLQGNGYQNNLDIKTPNIFSKFYELNRQMYAVNQALTASHPYSSRWYTWPLMIRPIYYWVQGNARIYFIGNPIIWWSSTIAVLYVLSIIAYKLWLKLRRYDISSSLLNSSNLLTILITGYVMNLLPFIGVKRVMFLYHYLAAYIFAVLMLVYLISKQKNSKQIFGVLLMISAIAFIFFAPLTYGLDLSPKAYELRVWFESWR